MTNIQCGERSAGQNDQEKQSSLRILPQLEQMRLFCATLLAVVCLVSAVINDASALTYYPDQASISAPNLRDSNTVLEKRVLTSNDADKADSKDDVERAYIPGLSSLAGTLSKISPSAQNVANKMWLKSRTDPALVFNTLRLGKTGVKLDDNPRFLLWLKYVDMYSGLRSHSFSDDQVFKLLQKSNSDEKLMALFQSLRKVPGRKALAEKDADLPVRTVGVLARAAERGVAQGW